MVYHGALADVHFLRRGRRVSFDEARLRRLLERIAPFLKPHHLYPFEHVPVENFIRGQCGIYPVFSYEYPRMPRDKRDLVAIPIPLKTGGFVCESIVAGAIRRDAADPENDGNFLQFLAGPKGQEALCRHHPEWLALHPGVLEWQKARSPFAPGAVRYDFDTRGSSHLKDVPLFADYGVRLTGVLTFSNLPASSF